jgi:hypothetical protein
MLALLDTLLSKMCGYSIDKCGQQPSAFLYLDDGIFTGNRIRRDLEDWLGSDAPAEAKVDVITMALHSGGWHCRTHSVIGSSLSGVPFPAYAGGAATYHRRNAMV